MIIADAGEHIQESKRYRKIYKNYLYQNAITPLNCNYVEIQPSAKYFV